MQTQTRKLFNKVREAVAHDNGVEDVAEKFTVSPSVEQRLTEQMTESADLLSKINIIGVTEQKGQKLGIGVGNPIASRTDTKDEERETAYVGEVNPDDYECMQTNFDTHLDYRVMDAWAIAKPRGTDPVGTFGVLYRKATLKRMALDRIMTGWNGTHAAKKTNRATYPLLQDVNAGWLEKVRANAPQRFMGYDSTGQATSDVYQIGEGGTYQTLDAAVFDVMASLLDAWHVGSDDLVLMLGRELWVNHGLNLYNDSRAATERNALQTWFATQAIAGLPTICPPFFPQRGLVVTSYDNLSIYYQTGGVRRAIIDNPKRDRVEEYLSSNDAYVVEDYGKFAAMRSSAIQLKHNGAWV
ncbi:MAG: phage major capsid protein, P2 family [Thiofilum sp.]|uniref:phage major capsid protein, P2 family n=1 Tax=Thiofilum sp. TaxID=2212733 RepID=UPI0025E283D2|nr:phage major capsid protein, P2 family [Thiofilum sp.]MBK8453617.1 phage major capsid protein, P2 family [Thiofilum sp.]